MAQNCFRLTMAALVAGLVLGCKSAAPTAAPFAGSSAASNAGPSRRPLAPSARPISLVESSKKENSADAATSQPRLSAQKPSAGNDLGLVRNGLVWDDENPIAAGKPDDAAASEATHSATIQQRAGALVSTQDPSSAPQSPNNGANQASPSADESSDDSSSSLSKLQLSEVITAVDLAFPMLYAAYLQQQVASGNQVAAQGAFDLNLKGSTISQPVGFYENYRQTLGLQQQLWNSGNTLYGGYKLGDGQFEPWYKERETNEGGELAVGTIIPLRKNRLIDAQRAELFKANQDLQAFDPFIQTQRNLFLRDAAIAYWVWVDSGNLLQIQRRLLQLAQDRARQIELRVTEGDLPELAGIDNQRLIAQRETKLIEATRKFQAAAIKLSLFLRDGEGQPLLAEESFVPTNFPGIATGVFQSLSQDIQTAINQHPEIRELDFEINKAQIDVQLAQNSVLGKLDLFLETSQDMGSRASALGDKSPLELEAGLMGELPLQRRAGLGKVTATQGKLQQWEFKRQFLADKISIGIRDSYSAYLTAKDRLDRATNNLTLAQRALTIGRQQFTAGNIDLIILNIYEQSVADAEILVVDANVGIQQAIIDYQFAIGSFAASGSVQ